MIPDCGSSGSRGASHVAKRAAYVLALIFSILILAAFISGCRYSEALYEVKTDQLNGQYEPRATPEYKDVDGAPEDPTRASTHLSESENLADQVNNLPVYAANSSNTEAADETTHDETTNDDTEAASGTEPSEQQDGSTSDSDENQDGEGADGKGEGEDKSSDEGDPEPDKTGGRGGEGKTYGDSSYDELPEARAIAAKGTYATIAQMLGGKGALAATDAQWKKDMKAAKAFPNEGIDKIPALWKGKNGNSLDVDALIKTNADVVLVDGVECTLTAKESKRLKAGGINIVSVPVLGLVDTADKDIESAVNVVAQLLSGSNAEIQLDTAQNAALWQDKHNEAIDACLSANGGHSYKLVDGNEYKGKYQGTKTHGEDNVSFSNNRIVTAFVDDQRSANKSSVVADRSWGDSPLYLNGEVMDLKNGVGTSVRVNEGNFALMDYYLQTAGVVNNAYEGTKPSAASSNGRTLPYAIIAGNSAGMLTSIGARNNSSALWLPLFSTASWTCVGDADFPGLLARNEDLADMISKSASKVNGLYNVGQPYYIQVVPEGIAGSWADGTPESFLLAPWAFGVFQNGSIDDAKTWIDDYYQTFYRIQNASSSNAIENLDTKKTAECPTT